MQQLMVQKQRLQIELTESDKALNTLEEVTDESNVYKSVGAVLVQKPRQDVVKELHERKEFLEMRLKVLEKQETKILQVFIY